MVVRTSSGNAFCTMEDGSGDVALVKPSTSRPNRLYTHGWTEDEQDSDERRHSKGQDIEKRDVHLQD